MFESTCVGVGVGVCVFGNNFGLTFVAKYRLYSSSVPLVFYYCGPKIERKTEKEDMEWERR